MEAPTLPQHPFLFSSREVSLYTTSLASDHLSQGQERLSQEILHQDMESKTTGETEDAESQPSPGDTAALTSVFQDGRILEALPCLCFEGWGRGPQTNSASWPCCYCSPQCHPTPHHLFHTPPSQSQPRSASPSACPRGGREGRGTVSKRHGWETKRQEQESRAGRMGLGPKKVELGLRGRRVLRKVV